MAISGNYINNSFNFRASDKKETPENAMSQIVTKPIEQVENIVNTTVDTFVPESSDEETKKSHKTAIKVGSTVLVLSAFVALLNPKFLTRFSNKLKTLSAKAGNKAKINGDFTSKIYSSGQKFLDSTSKVLNFTNNINTIKDEGFKWLCVKSRFMKKPHEWITKLFDSVSKKTVVNNYAKVNKNIDALNEVFTKYADKLPSSERKIFEQKLAEIKKTQEYFSSSKVEERLKIQENMMSTLEDKSLKKMKDYFGGYKMPSSIDNIKDNAKFAKDNLGYWAEDVLASQRAELGANGQKVVSSIVGDSKTQKGAYNELLDLLSSHLKPEEKKILEEFVKDTSKKLNKANISECAEYFDNKRDLMLGSAPTDILTALFFLGLGGVAVGRADTKQERVSKMLTSIFPTVAGLGVSLTLTALLFSGVKGKIVSALLSGVLSLMGSGLNRVVNPKRPEIKEAASV